MLLGFFEESFELQVAFRDIKELDFAFFLDLVDLVGLFELFMQLGDPG